MTKQEERLQQAEQALDQMRELGFDPLEVSVNIALGNALTQAHPALKKIATSLDRLESLLRSKKLMPALKHLDTLRPMVLDALSEERTSTETRAKYILELLKYAHPQLRAVDFKAKGTSLQSAFAAAAEKLREEQAEEAKPPVKKKAPTKKRRAKS